MDPGVICSAARRFGCENTYMQMPVCICLWEQFSGNALMRVNFLMVMFEYQMEFGGDIKVRCKWSMQSLNCTQQKEMKMKRKRKNSQRKKNYLSAILNTCYSNLAIKQWWLWLKWIGLGNFNSKVIIPTAVN